MYAADPTAQVKENNIKQQSKGVAKGKGNYSFAYTLKKGSPKKAFWVSEL